MSRSREHKPIKLVRSRLDDAGVAAHFASLANSARAIEIRIKGGRMDHSDASAPQLEDVERQLRGGAIIAVQIRFLRDGDCWCDTLTRRGDAFRLVRMRQ